MTITLSVREVLQNPVPFEKGFRLGVHGVLCLSYDVFYFYQIDDTWNDSFCVDVVDPEAASEVRRTLIENGLSSEYLGEAVIEAWTKIEATRVVLRGVVTLRLHPDQKTEIFINVRPHPWGW